MSAAYNSLQEAIGWLHVVVALAGVVVCAMNLQRSRWALVLLAGFGVEAIVSLGYRLFSFLIAHGTFTYSNVSWLFLMLSFLGIVATLVEVGGLAGLFAERGGPKRVVQDPGPADRA
jgi:hypothetical protein